MQQLGPAAGTCGHQPSGMEHMQLVLELQFGLHELVTVDEARLARVWPGTNFVLVELGYGGAWGAGTGGSAHHSGTHVMTVPFRSLPLQLLTAIATECLPLHLLQSSSNFNVGGGRFQIGDKSMQAGPHRGAQSRSGQGGKLGGFCAAVGTAAAVVQQQQELCL